MAFASMVCPKCGTSTASGARQCPNCSLPLNTDETETVVDSDATRALGNPNIHVQTGWTDPSQRGVLSYDSITPGSVIGNRYEIQRTLGEGGMGAVYAARDREVDRIVALKVIRPELAGNHDILHMFKQELILARQVTHENVIRIHDLGLADGLRFITMQFVEGKDLKTLLAEKGHFAPEEAAAIIVQVCAGLEVAHKQNVIHRDLKPQNIMIDAQGRTFVMDFGLAHDTGAGGAEGRLLGTPHYMSPEQARREELDARSDLFALGIIFYELLTGSLPVEAKTLDELLRKRGHQQVPQPIERDPTIPKPLNDVIVKCLALDRNERYQNAGEIIHDLQVWQGVLVPSNTKLWKRVTLAFAVLLVAAIGISVRTVLRRPVPAPKPVTMLVADFTNQTGESVLAEGPETLFVAAMEGAPFISAYNRAQAHQEAGEVQAGTKVLSDKVARLVAVRDGLNVVVDGVVAKQGNGYAISVKAEDAVTGKQLAQAEVKAPTKEKLLASIGKLAQPIRKALGDRTPVSNQVEAAETFTSASLEAVQQYSAGQNLLLMSKYKDAIDAYARAIQIDPNFGRAYSGLGVAYRNLGQRADAEKYLKLALVHISQMTDRERYRTRGAYYVTIGSYEKAVEEYSALVKQYPADSAGHANLAVALFHQRNLPRAIEESRKAIEIYPKNVGQRNNVALYTLYSGDFAGAEREAQAVMQLNPSFERPYFVMAAAELAQGHEGPAADWYHKLENVSAWGASYAALGLSDLAMYQGRPKDAAAILEKSLAGGVASDSNSVSARKLLALAEAYLAGGQAARALATADRAVKLDKAEDRLFAAALIQVQAGREAEARETAAEFQRKLEAGTQAYASLIEGEIALKHGEAREAIKQFEAAQKLMDTWLGRLGMARAYLQAEAFPEADSELDRAMKRKGEATSIFLDDIPTYRYFPPVYYYQGRVREGLLSPNAPDSYKAFLAIRANSAPDPLVRDARRRVAGH